MAQYFEVLSKNDGNLDQAHQFFNGNQENERTQVRYILADDTPQFQTQQLILSADQVMVLDGSQPQIQGVVINQGHAYQTSQPQQFGAVVQNAGAVVQSANMNNQPAQQIFYMETNSGPVPETVQAVQAVVEQSAQTTTQPQPIVLNHQMVGTPSVISSRQVLQGTPTQRPVLQIRTPARQGHIPVSQQPPRPHSLPMRQGLPQQIRPHQSAPPPMRALTPQQIQMRLRAATSLRPPVPQLQQPSPRPTALVQLPPEKSNLASLSRQMSALQQKQLQQQPPAQPVVQQSQPQAQQVVQQQPQQTVPQQQPRSLAVPSQIQKTLGEFQQRQQQQIKHSAEDELDDHDPTMNSSPGQIVNYKKLLEQRQQIGKNPILARLPSNIKVTPSSHQQQQTDAQRQCSISQTIDQVVNQVSQQQNQQQPVATVPQQTQASQVPIANVTNPAPQKKPRAPPRPKNPNPSRSPTGAARQRMQRIAVAQQPFSGPKGPGSQQPPAGPRFALNQQPQRYANQQQMMQQRSPHQQHQQQNAQPQPVPQPVPPPVVPHPSQQRAPLLQNGISNSAANQPQPSANHAHQSHQSQMSNSQSQQTGSNQSQMNYLITPPTPNRPRQQQPLPSYIPSSQIQQIIENTPIAEEFSDSIRMLVLLENGEQRLITFTLPKEACTIQEILEQVNVPFTPETNIQVTEANTNGINYIVTVGNVSNFGYGNNEEEQQEQPSELEPQKQVPALQPNQHVQQSTPDRAPFGPKLPPQLIPGLTPPQLEPPKAPTPELPKLIAGKLAVCSYCGYTGEDFNKCSRCTRKLPENVKSVEAPIKAVDAIHKPSQPEIAKHLTGITNNPPFLTAPPVKSNANPTTTTAAVSSSSSPAKSESGSKPPTPVKKKVTKSKPVEHESVVISSDEEEDEKKPVKSVSEQLLNKLGASISISPVTKEPSLTEVKKHVRKVFVEPPKLVKLPLKCRTVRIGSYRFAPNDDVILDSKCLIIKAPVVDNASEIKTVRIDRGDIIKVLICYNQSLPVIFYYLNVGAAPIIRDMLNLKKESGLYFDPIDEKEDSYRKITLLPEDILTEYKSVFQQLYSIAPYNIIDELTVKEANDILIKACPKDSSSSGIGSFSEIKQILMYPKEGQGRLSINTEDYVCLAVDQFLNDKIIDFYLKYLWENLPREQQEKVHIFSTFFYKRLTTKPTKALKKSHPFETDGTLTAAEKRHLRVRNWTKRVNIFEKDFVIVPINENAHWFLAIICFPALLGPQTFDGKPYNPEPKPRRNRNKQNPEVKKEKPIPCDDPLLSDKDEAESEDSDMESDDSEESVAAAAAAAAVAAAAIAAAAPPTPQPRSRGAPKIPVKQPCILIFDSLAGPNRCRVVATLRDYLTMEFKVKMESERVFTKDLIKGSNCKVPQQNNFTDCGLYLLQYVEQFFKDPIKDYNTPIKGIADWFEEIIVTKKREDICNLLKKLMIESGADIKILPDIALPTLNGKLVERQETDHDHDAGEDEQEDMFTDIEDSEMTDASSLNTTHATISEENGDPKSVDFQENSSSGENSPPGNLQSSPIKPSDSSIGDKSEIVSTIMQPAVLKPTLSEFARQTTTNKDTLNSLRSKRITRHKPHFEGPEYKKSKYDN